MLSKKELQVIREEGSQRPAEFNAWRLFPEDEKTLILQLGHRVDKTISVVCSAKFSPKILGSMIATFYRTGLAFEKQYGVDLGFGSKDSQKQAAEFPKTEANRK